MIVKEIICILSSTLKLSGAMLLCIRFCLTKEKKQIIKAFHERTMPDCGEVIEEGEEFTIDKEFVQEQKKSIILNRVTVLFILFGFLLEVFGRSCFPMLEAMISIPAAMILAVFVSRITERYALKTSTDMEFLEIRRDKNLGKFRNELKTIYDNKDGSSRQERYRRIKRLWLGLPELEQKLMKREFVRDSSFYKEYSVFHINVVTLFISTMIMIANIIMAFRSDMCKYINSGFIIIMLIIAATFIVVFLWLNQYGNSSDNQSFSKYMVDMIEMIEEENRQAD